MTFFVTVQPQLHCYRICLFPVAFDKGQILPWPALHVLTDFAKGLTFYFIFQNKLLIQNN